MSVMAHVLVGVAGALLAAGTLGSAIRTVVVPRGEQTLVAALVVFPVTAMFPFVWAGLAPHTPSATDRPIPVPKPPLFRRRS